VGATAVVGPDRIGPVSAEHVPVSTNRMESFSDGVIAVAITLLVLDITVPIARPGVSLAHQLAQHWPNYAAYVTSFVTIGIIWINHHAMISRLREADHLILILNNFLLLTIGILPFATALMAAYLRRPQGQHFAAAVYGGAFLVMAIAFSVLNRHILLRKSHLLVEELPESRRRAILRRSVAGVFPYVLAVALAPLSAYLTLGIAAALAVFYALPIASGTEAAR
jgi:uncharacterized membrane protein